MHFKRNQIITDTIEDEELLEKGKLNRIRKLYGVYIQNILVEESNEEHPLDIKHLCLRILERYSVYIDITTIQAYIREFRHLDNYELQGDEYDGYYFTPKNYSLYIKADDRLDDYQIHYLVELVRNMRNMPNTEKNSVIEKLTMMCSEEINKDYLLDKSITNKPIDKHKSYLTTRLLDDVPRIIKERLVIEIKEKRLIKNTNMELKPKKFYLYATIPCGDSLMLVGTYTLNGNAIFILPSRIEDYSILNDEHFNKVKLNLKPSVFLGEERIRLLQKENPNDFIFPTEKEWNDFNNKIQNQIKEREKEKKNEI